jgi:hypothetical protein
MEKAAEIIGALRDAGIKHVAFKPGSVNGIQQVVAIAATNPDYPHHAMDRWSHRQSSFMRRFPPAIKMSASEAARTVNLPSRPHGHGAFDAVKSISTVGSLHGTWHVLTLDPQEDDEYAYDEEEEEYQRG